MYWHYILISTLLSTAPVLVSSSSRGSGSVSFSPIRELGPSLAASVAGGTIIAARSPLRPPNRSDDVSVDGVDEEECLVILFRSPFVSQSGSESGMKQNNGDAGNLTITSVFGYQSDGENCIDSNTQQNNFNKYHGLSFLPNGPVNFPFLPSGSSNNLRILHAPSGLFMAATGFAPDADHILNVAAGRVFSRISVFDAPSTTSSSSSKSVDPHRLVREDLSSMMIDAAMSDGGRPLGVQLLVVGQSALSRRQNTNNNGSLEIYTIDPSGGWRSCVGRGTAVGRGAERVRAAFLHSWDESGIDNDDDAASEGNRMHCSWKEALENAMMSAIDGLEQDDNSNDDDAGEKDDARKESMAKYGAMVIFGNSDGCKRHYLSTSRCAAVSPAIVEEYYDRCLKRIRNHRLASKK